MHKAPSNSLTVHLKYILFFFLSSALGFSRCPSSSFSHQQDGGHDPWLPSTSHQRAQGVSIWFLQPSFCSKVLKTCKYLWYYFCHCWKLDATKDLLFDAGLEEVNRITFLHRPVRWGFWGTLKIIWFDHSWLTLGEKFMRLEWFFRVFHVEAKMSEGLLSEWFFWQWTKCCLHVE